MKNQNFQTQENLLARNVQIISNIYHEILSLMNFSQNKPQVKIMNIN